MFEFVEQLTLSGSAILQTESSLSSEGRSNKKRQTKRSDVCFCRA